MRIVYHHRTLGDGAEGIHIREMVKAFRQLGHTVMVDGPVGEKVPTADRWPGFLSQVRKHLPGWLFELLEVAYSLVSFVTIHTKIRALRPDFVYDRYMIFNVGALLAARWHRIPYILEVNAPLALERSSQPDEKLYFRKLAGLIETYVCSSADTTLVVSSPLKDYLESVGVPPRKCMVMPNGVDHVSFAPRPKKDELVEWLNVEPDATVIGFTGILRPWHGVELLVRACAQLVSQGKNIYLLIVGDGQIRDSIVQSLTESGLSSRSWITGIMAHEQVSDFVNIFDIAVSPDATFYASPMKIVEYMALGKAVVAPDSPNLRDLVDDRVNGMLFQRNSLESLTGILGELCDSPLRRGQIGSRAHMKVQQRLNWAWNARVVCTLAGAP